MRRASGSFFQQFSDILCCPRCAGDLSLFDEATFGCERCQQRCQTQEGIPSLYAPNEWEDSKEDVTETIKAFYEAYPFPSYDDFDSAASLMEQARRGVFAQLLDDQIPFGARVLECGCGTGQLTNFLSIANRTVIGTDVVLNSLKMATAFKRSNSLDRAHFLQMNLFRPAFKCGSFDFVISNGVLHHTSDPFLGFKSIATLVRPGGYLLIGLYHRYGRLATDLRRWWFNITDDRLQWLDRHAVDPNISSEKRRSWFMDQYKHPHESKHTVDEILGWLRAIDFEFVRTIPKSFPLTRMGDDEGLFTPQPIGSTFERRLANLAMAFAGHRDGGFFFTIARRPEKGHRSNPS